MSDVVKDYHTGYIAEQHFGDCIANCLNRAPLCDSFILEAIIIPVDERVDQISEFELICQKETILNIPGAVLFATPNIKVIDGYYYIPLSSTIKYIDTSEKKSNMQTKEEIQYTHENKICARLNATTNFRYKIVRTIFFYAAEIPRSTCHVVDYYINTKLNSDSLVISATVYICGVYLDIADEITSFNCQIDNDKYIIANEFSIKMLENRISHTLNFNQIYKTSLFIKLSAYFCGDILELLFKYIKGVNSNLYYFSSDNLAKKNREETVRVVHRNISMQIATKSGIYRGNIYIKCKNMLFVRDGVAKLRYS
jgi:hypothetical protein